MSITVVTVRDDAGAPLTREVYAAGDRYRTTDGDLEVYSAKPQLLAYYPSGNWLSAYHDDTVRVLSGPPQPGDYAGLGSAPPVVSAGTELPAGVAGLDLGGDTEPGIAPTELEPVLSDEAEAVEVGDGVESSVSAAQSRSTVDVAVPDQPDTAFSVALAAGPAPTTEPPSGSPKVPTLPSPWLRPVTFKPITTRVSRRALDNGPDKSRLRPVSFGPKQLNPRPKSEPEEPRSRLRPVTFRPKIYRAARPQAPDDAGRDDGADGDAQT